MAKANQQKSTVLQILPYDINRYLPEELAPMVMRATEFFVAVPAPMRILTYSQPYSLQGAVDTTREQLIQHAPPGHFRHDPLIAQWRDLESMMQRLQLRNLVNYLVVWPSSETPYAAGPLRDMASASFRTPVLIRPQVPPAFQGRYLERYDHLAPAPENIGQPLLRVLIVYTLQGEWNPYSIHAMLQMECSFCMAQNIYTYTPGRANMVLTNAAGALSAQMMASAKATSVRDTKGERSSEDCDRAMHEVELGQRFHKVSHVILLKAATLPELDRITQTVVATQGAKLPMRVARGQQLDLMRYFSTTPESQMAVHAPEIPMLSQGLAVMVPFSKRVRTSTDGVQLGIETSGYPLFDQGWVEVGGGGAKAHHRIVAGETGSGKTFGVQVWALREILTNGAQVIFLEPQGHSRRLIDAVGEGGVYYPLSFATTRINPLDLVVDPDKQTLSDQIAHVERQLHVLINSTVGAYGGGAMARGRDLRTLSRLERGALDRALQELYGSDWRELDAATTPLLSDLCVRLSHIEHGTLLADELRGLFVDGSLAAVFNQPSNIDLSFQHPATAVDVSGVDESYRTFFYGQIMASMRRRSLRKPAGQRLLNIIDELQYMAQEPNLLQQVALEVKTARTRNTAYWLVEQNMITFANSEAGVFIAENTPEQFFFRQSGSAVDLIRQANPQITPRQLMLMTMAGRGEAVVRLANDVFHIHVAANPYEYRYFGGT